MSPTRQRLAGFACVLAAALAFAASPGARWIDDWILDHQFRLLRHLGPAPVAENDVVVVGIDEDTYREFPEPVALWHRHVGRLFEALAAGRPAAVGLDIVLPDRSYDFLVPGHDRRLLAGLLKLARTAPLILGQTVDERARLRPLFPPLLAVAGREAVGLVLVRPDPDRVVRRYATSLAADRGRLPTLAGAMWRRLGGDEDAGIIDFRLGAPFSYVPVQEVIGWHESGATDRLAETFAGKPVLVGTVLPFDDLHLVPVALAGWLPETRNLPGVLIHAQALRSLGAGGFVRPVHRGLVLALAALATAFWWLGHLPVRGAALLIAGAAAALALGTHALAGGVHWPLAGILLAAALSLGGRLGLEAVLTAREKRRLTRSFSGYVSPDVLDGILAGEISETSGSDRREVCVLFSDIRDFTTRSESQPPEAVVSLLNDYFEEMTAAVHGHGGTVDKFIGDGLMCFFGAPAVQPRAARSAFDAAREMLSRLEVLNARFEERMIEPVHIGIGLHLGDVVVGHVGSASRHEYTVIGDTVNVAARLEGLTKALGYPILVSESTARAVGDDVAFADLGMQGVKGHTEVRVFGWRSPEPT